MFPIVLALLASDPGPAVRFFPDRVEVVNLRMTDRDPAKLRVTLAATPDTPLLGAAEKTDTGVRFTPRFPFAPGVAVRATYSPLGLTADHTPPEPPPAPPTRFVALYPSETTVPENALRFYVHFSAGMATGDSFRHIKLFNETDRVAVTLPFLELDEELWTADRTRFTLLIDPGRIKREVKPREDLGPALEAGKVYTLSINAAWPDADGRPLAAGGAKTFTVSPPERRPIDPAAWKLTPPAAGTPLRVDFGRVLDRALMVRMITVVGPDGQPFPATPAAVPGERGVEFAAKSWPAGAYELVTDTRLEDPCGNRVGEAFEVDVFRPPTVAVKPKTVRRGFVVK